MLNKRLNIFHYTLLWHLSDSISYGILLTIHQSFLFFWGGSSFCGQVSAIFGTIYTLVAIATLGFDPTISPYISLWNNKKRYAIRIIGTNILINTIIISMFFVIMLNVASLQCLITTFPTLIMIIIIIEVIRRTLKHILQLLYLSKITALLEMITMCTYLLIVWIPVFLGSIITIEKLLWALLITSGVSCAIWAIYLIKHYNNIPRDHHHLNIPDIRQEPSIIKIIHRRLLLIAQEIPNLLFSHNTISPLIAIKKGYDVAGICKIVMSITYALVHSIHKVCYTQSTILFAYSTNSIEKKNNLIKMTYYGLILSSLTIPIFIVIFIVLPFNQAYLAALCIIIVIFQNLTIIYERFLLNEKKYHFANLSNAMITLLMTLNAYWYQMPIDMYLGSYLIGKMITFFILLYSTYYIPL